LHVSFIADVAWGVIKTGNHILNMAIGFVVLNLLSILIFYFIEQPLHHWLHHARLHRWSLQLQILGLRCSFFIKNLLGRKPQLNN
jgi:peptidoglycan/LPS O-acetylase OafA/YrhL